MKTFTRTAAHGELYIRRMGHLPDRVREAYREGKVAPWEDGKLVVGHSETGHHHAFILDKDRKKMQARSPRAVHAMPVAMIPDPDDPLTKWLVVNRPQVLYHLREHHRHEALRFEPGIYEVREQREWRGGAWGRVND